VEVEVPAVVNDVIASSTFRCSLSLLATAQLLRQKIKEGSSGAEAFLHFWSCVHLSDEREARRIQAEA